MPLRRDPPGGARSTLRWRRSRTARKMPSIEWRRQFSLLLGLERLLSEEEPHLVDGTVLSAHQVDALSGTLTALLAEAQRNGNGSTAQRRNGERRPPALARHEPVRARRRGDGANPTTTRTMTDEAMRGRRERTRTRSPRTGRTRPTSERRGAARRSSPRTPTPTGASGSSTRPAPARPSRRSDSSRPRAPAAS